MIHLLPTEHLSPTQLLALKRLESGDQIEVRSTSINSLIEIINLLNKGTEITFCCGPLVLRNLQNYKERHVQPEGVQDVIRLSESYSLALDRIKNNYENCYPKAEKAIRHQYLALLRSFDLNLTDNVDVDGRLKGIRLGLSNRNTEISKLLSIYKRTWDRYFEIDPMQHIFYTTSTDESLSFDLTMWIATVNEIYKDLQNGLNEIIEEEKSRLLDIKKRLKQCLVNYQHNRTATDLEQIRRKIGFLTADLPKKYIGDISKLAMFAVNNWESLTVKYLARHSRRFNSRNHESKLMQEAMKRLTVVLRDIDQNGLVTVNISNNPLSYEKQIIQVEDLLHQLYFCKYWIADEGDYIAWRKLYETSTIDDKPLLNILTTLDSSVLQDQLKYIEIQQWKNYVRDKGIPTTNDSHALFEAYKAFNTVIDWSSVKLVADTVCNGDYTVTFDGAHYILNNRSDTAQRCSITLNDKTLENIKPMVTLDYYNKSKQANQLAEAVVASKAKIRTFQTKSLNIISFLDYTDNEEILRLFADAKINELKGESESDLIKGSILEEGKEKILLVYDDMLNVRLIEHYIWQRLVIQCMSSAGYTVISVNTEDALDHISLEKYLASYLHNSSNVTAKYAL